jgi:hypothetical protein
MNKTQSAKSKSAAIVRMNIGPDNERNFMKKLMATLTILAVVAGGTQTASAGDREWATAGKVLTGVVAGAVIARSFEPAPVFACPPAVVYTPSPGPGFYVRQAPVVVYVSPVFVRPAPVCVAPPVVTFGIGLGGVHHHRRPHRICW